MSIYYPPTLLTELAYSNLFFDTNTFIGAISYPGIFGELFEKLKDNDCAFLTIPSVVFEYTRGIGSIADFDKRSEFIDGFVDTIYPIEKHIEDLRELIIVLQRIKGDIHYTDFLLIACLYKFPRAFLISANHKDCPLDILDRKCVITVDTDKDIKNYGIYQFSMEKFNKAAESILRG
jgi:hypothetical protein